MGERHEANGALCPGREFLRTALRRAVVRLQVWLCGNVFGFPGSRSGPGNVYSSGPGATEKWEYVGSRGLRCLSGAIDGPAREWTSDGELMGRVRCAYQRF